MPKKTLAAIAATLALALVGAIGGWRLAVKPKRDLVRLRYEALEDLLKLYDLQVKYKALRGTYANGLDTLLFIDSDRARFKARLAAHADLDTVTVVDEGAKFKIEINILDGERTLMKIKGPLGTPPRSSTR